MKKNALFWRLFWAFFGALTATALLLSSFMVVMMRNERRTSLENEVRVQARDLAQLIKQSYMLSIFQLETGSIQWKIDEIRSAYGAEISLIYRNGYAQRAAAFTAELSDPNVIELINRVLSGEEIRAQGVFAASPSVLTVGVPYEGGAGQALGALLLHLSVNALNADYGDIALYAAVAVAASMLLGAGLSYLIASRQSRPLRAINEAVAEFSAGRFDSRVGVSGGGELAALAASFNRMAEELSNLEESRRGFVANVSHELRSPMTSIQGYVHGILDGTIAPGEQSKYLEIVLSETRRLTKLVNELLELSRYDSGKAELTIAKFDVNALILNVLFKYEQRIEAKGIDVEITFREPQCAVAADADAITQVLENLTDNAIKYADEGGRITVWTHSVDALCYVTIKNTGPGVPPGDQAFLFDRFFKGDKAHTSGMGTGLGLSIAKKIVEQHGQNISGGFGGEETSFVFTLRRDV